MCRTVYAGLLAVLAAAAPACSGEETVWIELPPAAGASSLILAVTTELGELSVRAVALPAVSAPVVAVDNAGDASIEAVVYRATLEELAIGEGLLPEVADGDRTLPRPDATFALRLRDGRGAGWTATPGMSDAVATHRFIGLANRECAVFDAQVMELDTPMDNSFAIAVDEDRALVGTTDGRVYLFVRGGGITRIDVVPQKTLMAAEHGELGDLWFGSDKGELFRGELRDGALSLTYVATSMSKENLHWFSAGTTDDGLELYSLSIEGSFERFRLGHWVSLVKFEPGVPGDEVGGVVRVGSGRAFATWPKSPDVTVAEADTTSVVQTPISGGLAAIANVPALGVVAGTAEGGFIYFDGRQWILLPGSPFTFAVNAVVAYGPGFLFGGPVGNLGQYLVGRGGGGYCAIQQPAPHWIRYIAVMGDDLLVAGSNDTFPETPVTFLKRRAL